MSLRLIIEDDEGATTIVPLGKDAITIGRQQGNTIQLTEKNVSRRHARLVPDSNSWVIEDLNSYNGVKVNDRAVDGRMLLREGDIVQIGDYHLAITEDVDKSTLNFDRQGRAANDPAGEPLLASSSADLPRLSPEEIHALQSGPQPITPQPHPAIIDSGPMPQQAYAHAYHEPEPRRGAGLLIGFAIVVVGALGLGVFWLATTGNGPDKPIASGTDPGKATPPQKAEPEPVPSDEGSALADGDDAVPAADDGQLAVAPSDDATPPDAGDDDDAAAVEVIDDDPEPTPVTPKSGSTSGTKKSGSSTSSKSGSTSKSPSNGSSGTSQPPPPPPPPAGKDGKDPEALLAEARKKNLTSPKEAYALAQESYNIKASQNAISLMTVSACKMGDVGKAQKWYAKLKGSLKTDAEKFCASKNITL